MIKLDKQKIITKILDILPQTKAIYLFGSYVSGDNNTQSDVDIALLFSHIETKKIGNLYLSKLHLELENMLNLDVDLVNLRSASTILQNEITYNGIVIFSNDQYMVEEFEMLTLSLYQKLNEERKGILNEISDSKKILD